jgi:hypothetical protein
MTNSIDTNQTITVDQDPAKMVGIMLGCLAFVGLGLVLVLVPSDISRHAKAAVAGWLCITFFGGLAILALVRLVTQRSGPVLTISPWGFRDTRFSDTVIPWSQIVEVTDWSYRSQTMVRLIIAPSFETGIPLKVYARVTRPLNEGLGAGGLVSPATGLRISDHDLRDVVTAYHQRYGSTGTVSGPR